MRGQVANENLQYSYTYLDDKDLAIADPTLDFFRDQNHWIPKPKATIGSYVADNGFEVPLISSDEEWVQAISDGNAMIRSEAPNEYDGLRGIFHSARVPRLKSISTAAGQLASKQRIVQAAVEGLQSGEISPEEYMHYFAGEYITWPESLARTLQQAQWAHINLDIDFPQASLWRYVEGDNVSIFGDPNVEGRYHVGFSPYTESGYRTPGGFWIEPHEHHKVHRFRKHDKDFAAAPVIETYEAIAALPLFDVEQRPVLELQVAKDGVIHFLQYYKTGHKKNFVEPFELEFSPDTDIKFEMVRGITSEQGESMRLYVAPHVLPRQMEGQGIFCGLNQPSRQVVQFASKVAKFVLQEGYISFQDNHLSSTPLFMPEIAAGFNWVTRDTNKELARQIHQKIEKAMIQGFHDRTNVGYFDIEIASNGREIVIKSDWDLKVIPYSDLS